jgi:hypothetical protein
MIGVAKRDVYVVATVLPFWQNFFKGIIGLWFCVLLVLGLAVACSTYLSGIISLLCCFFLYGGGRLREYIYAVATRKAEAAGPIDALMHIVTHKSSGSQLEATPTARVGSAIDLGFRGVLRFVLEVLPDVNRFDLTAYVSNGFDISWTQVLLIDNVIPLIGYLVPWAVLAYYLMNSREIANPT